MLIHSASQAPISFVISFNPSWGCQNRSKSSTLLNQLRLATSLGLNIIIPGGYQSLRDQQAIDFIYEINKHIKLRAGELLEMFVGTAEPAQCGSRHQLLPLEVPQIMNIRELPWLTEHSKELLIESAHFLKDASERLLNAANRHHKLASHLTVSNGIAYTFSLSSAETITSNGQSAICMSISPRLFSDVGGAGLFGCRSIHAVMINRGEGIFGIEAAGTGDGSSKVS